MEGGESWGKGRLRTAAPHGGEALGMNTGASLSSQSSCGCLPLVKPDRSLKTGEPPRTSAEGQVGLQGQRGGIQPALLQHLRWRRWAWEPGGKPGPIPASSLLGLPAPSALLVQLSKCQAAPRPG